MQPSVVLNQYFTQISAKKVKINFFGIMRYMDGYNQTLNVPRIGYTQQLSSDFFRLRQTPTLAFCAREIDKISYANGKWTIHLFSLGLWGANSPLPIYFTEYAKEKQHAKDYAFSDFIDIFHHRYLGLFYKAWAIHQPALELDHANESLLLRKMHALLGQTPENPSNKSTHRLYLSAAAMLYQQNRPLYSLAQWIQAYFQVPTRAVPFIEDWLTIPNEDITYLGGQRPPKLGINSLLGKKVLEVQNAFEVRLGPGHFSDLRRFIKGEKAYHLLKKMIYRFIGPSQECNLKLEIESTSIPVARLSRMPSKMAQLSRGCSLGTSKARSTIATLAYAKIFTSKD